MELYTPPQSPRIVPVISLAGADTPQGRADIALQIHRACREMGFFYIADHGVPPELIAAQFAFAAKFFALPSVEKQRLHMTNSPTRAGYAPIGGQASDSQDADSEKAPPDLKESYYLGVETTLDHPFHGKFNGFGYNLWPDLPGFRDQMLAYHAALCALGDRVLQLIALSLDMSEDWFSPYYVDASAILRLMRYPPHPEDAQQKQLGAGAHTDWGGITLLAQDTAGGLEVRSADGTWISAPPIKDTFVVNLGDLMARWTNGLYNSNTHRVKNSVSQHERFSVPFFYTPAPTSIIAPIPSCVTADHPPRFEICTSAEHTAEMFRRSYGYEPST